MAGEWITIFLLFRLLRTKITTTVTQTTPTAAPTRTPNITATAPEPSSPVPMQIQERMEDHLYICSLGWKEKQHLSTSMIALTILSHTTHYENCKPGSGALGGLLEQVGLQAGVFAIRVNWVE